MENLQSRNKELLCRESAQLVSGPCQQNLGVADAEFEKTRGGYLSPDYPGRRLLKVVSGNVFPCSLQLIRSIVAVMRVPKRSLYY